MAQLVPVMGPPPQGAFYGPPTVMYGPGQGYGPPPGFQAQPGFQMQRPGQGMPMGHPAMFIPPDPPASRYSRKPIPKELRAAAHAARAASSVQQQQQYLPHEGFDPPVHLGPQGMGFSNGFTNSGLRQNLGRPMKAVSQMDHSMDPGGKVYSDYQPTLPDRNYKVQGFEPRDLPLAEFLAQRRKAEEDEALKQFDAIAIDMDQESHVDMDQRSLPPIPDSSRREDREEESGRSQTRSHQKSDKRSDKRDERRRRSPSPESDRRRSPTPERERRRRSPESIAPPPRDRMPERKPSDRDVYRRLPRSELYDRSPPRREERSPRRDERRRRKSPRRGSARKRNPYYDERRAFSDDEYSVDYYSDIDQIYRRIRDDFDVEYYKGPDRRGMDYNAYAGRLPERGPPMPDPRYDRKQRYFDDGDPIYQRRIQPAFDRNYGRTDKNRYDYEDVYNRNRPDRYYDRRMEPVEGMYETRLPARRGYGPPPMQPMYPPAPPPRGGNFWMAYR